MKAYLDLVSDDGKALLLQDIEDTNEYEKESLMLWISERKYWSIKEGRAHKYSHSIEDVEYAKKIFKTNNGKLIINDTYRSLRKKFSIFDMNGGNCPFVTRKYKTVTFLNEWYNPITLEITSDIEIKQGKDSYGDNVWIFEIRLGNK